MRKNNATMKIGADFPELKNIMKEVVEMFKVLNAIDYIEIVFDYKTEDEFTFLIQKKEGLTPSEKNILLERKIKRLQEKLELKK